MPKPAPLCRTATGRSLLHSKLRALVVDTLIVFHAKVVSLLFTLSGNSFLFLQKRKGDTAAVSGSWKLPLPAPATTVAKNQCLTCCLTCCFWCWISHWVLLILSWNMWLRGRSGGLWLGRDPGGVGGSVKIGDWVFDLVGVFPWLRSFGLTFRLLVLREYSYLGVYLSAVTIWSMPFVLVSCC